MKSVMETKFKMFFFFLFLLLLSACNMMHAQEKHQDLSTLFSYNQEQLYGFIGDNYQRLILHYDTIYKESDQNKYHAEGYVIYRKDKIRWKAVIQPEKTTRNSHNSYVLLSKFTMVLSDSSHIEGCFTTLYRKEGNTIVYDDSGFTSDSYMNNYFVGKWKYKGDIQKCCWGEFRIPESGDLDIGAGEFSPNEKYYSYGWDDFE